MSTRHTGRCLLVAATASAALHVLLIAALCVVAVAEPTPSPKDTCREAEYAALLRLARVDRGTSQPPPPETFTSIVLSGSAEDSSNTSEPPPTPTVRMPAMGRPGTVAPAALDKSDNGSHGSGIGNRKGGNTETCAGWFAGTASAPSVVFLLDRSLSMGFDGRLQRARAEVLAALRMLPESTRFQIVRYNRSAELLHIEGRSDLLTPTRDIIDRTAHILTEETPASGGTDHVQALRCALALHPALIVLVTDADEDVTPHDGLKLADVDALTRLNGGRSQVDIVEMGGRGSNSTETALERLVRLNRGVYKRVRLE